MERDIYDEDHEAFRDVVKEFIKRYASDEKRKQWDRDGEVDRATMRAAGESGIIGLAVPEEYGGAGMLQDYRFRAVVLEETSCTWARMSRSRSGFPAWRPARSSVRSR